jgi:recombination endonuclease VII
MTKPKPRPCARCGAVDVVGKSVKYCSGCSTSCDQHDNMKKGCKPCHNALNRAIRGPAKPRQPGCVEHGDYTHSCTSCRRIYKYEVTAEDLEILEAIRECEICGSNASLVVDHNHRTNEVRGMICGPCNSALGMANDSIATLEAMITYLKERGSYGS